MNRPQVILNLFASADGRIATAPGRNVMEWTAADIDGDANDLCHTLFDDLNCDCLLSGSESLMIWGAHQVQTAKSVHWPQKSRAYIVIDGRGRIDWAQTEQLIVITREDVAPSYLEQLQQKGIQYITAGRGEHVDLHLALAKLYELGFRRVGLSGGGSMNGAFLRESLVDEVSIVYAPLLVGGQTTPTLYDAPDAIGLEQLTRLHLHALGTVGEKGAFWAHYYVQR